VARVRGQMIADRDATLLDELARVTQERDKALDLLAKARAYHLAHPEWCYVCGNTGIVTKTDQDCPNYENHEPMPTGNVEFDEWSRRLNKTKKNSKCPDCGLYNIWTLRPASSEGE
jgi:hypothetical protein